MRKVRKDSRVKMRKRKAGYVQVKAYSRRSNNVRSHYRRRQR